MAARSRLALAVGLAVLGMSGVPTVSAGADAADACAREINRRQRHYLDALTTAVGRCTSAAMADAAAPSLAACRLAVQARQADGPIARAHAKLLAGIARRCGGANRRCEAAPGDGDVSLAAIGWDTAQCVSLQGRCLGPIATCDDVASCLACVANESVDQGLERLVYEPLALDGDATCRRAVAKETVRFVQQKARALGKCADAVLAGRPGFLHDAACPDADTSGRTRTRLRRAEGRLIRHLCRRCGGDDDANGDGACDRPGSLEGIVATPYVCPDVTLPASIPYPSGRACDAWNPVTTLDGYIGCLACALEFLGDCTGAAARGDPDPGPRYPDTCRRPRPPDLVLANVGEPDQRCRRDTTGGYRCETVADDAGNSEDVAVADLDHDGRGDLVFASNGEQRNRVCLGRGLGSFACHAIDVPNFAQHVAVGHVDADGHPDLVFALGTAGRNRVCLGDGTGAFTCADVSADVADSLGVALADLNDDGHVDAVFANASMETNRLCLGDGAGTFQCRDVSPDANRSTSVAIGDLDGNDTPDLVFGNIESIPPIDQRNRVCLNDGAGAFTCSDLSTDTDRTIAVALGDLDANGTLDVVLANDNQQRNRVCLGDGTGRFACDDAGDDALASSDGLVADLDGDGHLDAAFANAALAFGERNRICRGDGGGRFACADLSADVTLSRGIATAGF